MGRRGFHNMMMAIHQQQQAAAAAANAAVAAANQRAAEAEAALAARRAADAVLAAAAAAMPPSPVCSLAEMRAKLSAWRPGRSAGRRLRVPRANIGILGIRGCGKSSFLNAIMSAAIGEAISPAQVAPGDNHVTRELFAYDAFDGARLFDLWGWTDGYSMDAELLAAGRLPEGVRYDDVPTLNDPRLVQQPTFAQHEMHAMVIALPYGHHNEALYGPMLMRVRETIRALERTRVPVFVLLTKSDTATGPNGVTPDLANFYESALLHDARKALASILGIEKDHVLAVSAPVGNERVEISNELRDRSWSICLTALDAILRDVNTFYDSVANNRVKRFNAHLFPIDTVPVFEATNGQLWLAEGCDLVPTNYRATDLDESGMSCRIQLTLDGVEYECIARASAALISALAELMFDVRDREHVKCIANGCVALANPVAMVRLHR